MSISKSMSQIKVRKRYTSPYLSSIRFRNFKAFSDTGKIPLKPITLIVGKNSAGKSSLIRGLAAAAQTTKEIKPDDTDFRLIGENVNLGTYFDTIHLNNKEDNFTLDFEIMPGREGYDFRYNFSYTYTNDINDPLRAKLHSIKVENNSVELLRASEPYKKIPPRLINDFPLLNSPIKHSILKKLVINKEIRFPNQSDDKESNSEQSKILEDAMRAFSEVMSKGKTPKEVEPETYHIAELEDFAIQFHQNRSMFSFAFDRNNSLRERIGETESMSNTLRRFLTNSSYIGPIRLEPVREAKLAQGSSSRIGSKGENLEKLLHNKISDIKFKNELNQHLKDLGIADSIHTLPSFTKVDGKDEPTGYIKVQLEKSGRTRSLMDLGSGTSQVLPVVFEIVVRKDTLILLEQPELHLHPAAQSAMGSVLKSAIEQGNQLIVETHSANIIERLRRLIREGELDKNYVNIIYVGSNNKNETFCQNIGFDENGEFTEEWPEDTFFGEREKEYLGW